MFTDILKALLIKSNITQALFAEKIGVRPNTVSDWLNRGNSPKLHSIYRIAEFFNVSFDYLFTGHDTECIVNATEIKQEAFAVDERSLINTYRELNDEGKLKMLDNAKVIWADYRKPNEISYPKSKSYYYPMSEKNVEDAG